MARINNLPNFLEDVANAIKTKRGSDTAIPAYDFDTEILALPNQGIYQSKQINITTNGNYIVSPDEGYDAMETLKLTVEVPTSSDTSDATATSLDIISPKTAYARGQKLTGIIQENYVDAGAGSVITNNNSINTVLPSAYNKSGLMVQRNGAKLELYILDENDIATLVLEESSFFETAIYHTKKMILSEPIYEDEDGIKDYLLIYTTSTFDGVTSSRFDWNNTRVDTIRFAKIHFENETYSISKFSTTYTNTDTGVNCTGWLDMAIYQRIPTEIFMVITQSTNTNNYARHISTFLLTYANDSITFRKIDGGRFVTSISNYGSDCRPWNLSVELQSDNCYHVVVDTAKSTQDPNIDTQHQHTISHYIYNVEGRYIRNMNIVDSTNTGNTPTGIIMKDYVITCICSSKTLTFRLYKDSSTASPTLLHTFNVFASDFPLTISWVRLEAINNMIVAVVGNNTSQICTFYVLLIKNDELTFNKEYSGLLSGIQSQSSFNFTAIGNNKNTKVYIPSTLGLYIIEYTATQKIRTRLNDQNYNYYNTYDAIGTEAQVLEGSIVYNKTGKIQGTMPNNGSVVYTPSVTQQNIADGYHSGSYIRAVTNDIDINIIPENIRNGVTILGVNGNYEGATGGDATSDGNLQAKYLLEGYSAIVDGKIIQGTMKDYGNKTIIATSEDVTIPEGHYLSLSIPVINAANCEDYSVCSQTILSI